MSEQIATERKEAGLLLHISSLPSKYGIGTLGKEAYKLVDLLYANGIKYWQVLPLVQTSFGDSPYQSPSGGSGNPYFIDLDTLHKEGLLTKSEMSECRHGGAKVDYAFLYEHKYAVLRKAFARFDTSAEDFRAFVSSGRFDDYAVFMAIKDTYHGASFDIWDDGYKFAEKDAIDRFRAEHKNEIDFWLFCQYEFFKQWRALKSYANERGISIIGDIPLYVAYDSADVWASPRLFKLGSDKTPKKVAGVPPDYFSATGQLWGNPVYDWAEHKREGFAWWIERIRQAFEIYDMVRLDHFRGIDRYYEIDAGESTAMNGVWVDGPKYELFRALENALGRLNLIAEDLGVLDDGVYKLMDECGYPGMKVMEFAFDGNPNNPYLPHNFGYNAVCYTGTHDNDTLLGQIRSLDKYNFKLFVSSLKDALKRANLDCELATKQDMARAVIKLALSSPAKLVVLPMQDILLLGSNKRMNTPGTVGDNWHFRLKETIGEDTLKVLKR